MHITIGIFGNRDFVKKLAKQGTVNDIMIYNHTSSEGVFTYVAPNSPEEKIQPLLQAINMIDVPVIVSDELTKELAEQIIALDAFGFEKGFVISSSEDLKKIIRGTSIEKFEWLADERILMEKIRSIKSSPATDEIWIPVDNYFNVKSVGTVILSVMKGGTVKKYDKLTIEPLGKEVVVKGIQSQDKDIEEASQGMRVGLSLKGVDADDIKRGYVICKKSLVSKNVSIEFSKNKYSKEAMGIGTQIFLSIGVQVIAGRIEKEEGNILSVLLEQPAVYLTGQKCMLASTTQKLPRILGTGIMR
ncbi:MAG: EF-Tu/IF-2/RF-3 family GTPase [Candidatus Aenigmatarchaeota archaeon]